MGKRLYIIYDRRAMPRYGSDTDNASVCLATRNKATAWKERDSWPFLGGVACYSYATGGKVLTDQRFEWEYIYPLEGM